MWPFVSDPPSAVQFITLLLCLVMGLSHLLRPGIWVRFFTLLADKGMSGVIVQGLVSAPPAALIVVLHEVWYGPALVVTILGWMLMAKVWVGLLLPEKGLRSLKLARDNERGFRFAGVVLLFVAASAGLALWQGA